MKYLLTKPVISQSSYGEWNLMQVVEDDTGERWVLHFVTRSTEKNDEWITFFREGSYHQGDKTFNPSIYWREEDFERQKQIFQREGLDLKEFNPMPLSASPFGDIFLELQGIWDEIRNMVVPARESKNYVAQG